MVVNAVTVVSTAAQLEYRLNITVRYWRTRQSSAMCGSIQ
jgi:hypothetical protein